MTVRIAQVRDVAVGIRSFELVPVDGARLPAFSAGAHIDVQTPGGPVRQYSLCNDPAERERYVIAVARGPASRGGSAAMHDAPGSGDLLRISEPRNRFALAPHARSTLLVAGGIGITPLLAMARQLAAQGSPFELHYCTKSRDRTAFHDELHTAPFASSVHLHFSQPEGGGGGRADFAALLANAAPGTHLYVCGPKPFMDSVLAQARAAGWPEDRLHCEFFANDATPSDGDRPFHVRLASCGLVVEVPAGQSVTQTLETQGIRIPVSCGEGICGTCVTRVLDGIPDHRDLYFGAVEHAANDRFTPCCSRAKSPLLVLDL